MSGNDLDRLTVPNFVGREQELQWLDERLTSRRRGHSPIVVTGIAGVGKTALLRQYLYRHASRPAKWLDLSSAVNPSAAILEFADTLRQQWERDGFIVVIDGIDVLANEELQAGLQRLMPLKVVRSLVMLSQTPTNISDAEILNLYALPSADAVQLLEMLSASGLPQEIAEEAAQASKGLPLALSLIAELLKSGNLSRVRQILRGNLYDIGDAAGASRNFISSLGPRIVSATDYLVAQLRKNPGAVYELSPRRFEELLADLLTDMGWEVELTRSTRDGGKDLLAYFETEVGRFLCLVEAKRYRRDRVVGVDLVRNLYGTLCDFQANSAMLVTTSSFSRDAREFQSRHSYQLSLREYADVIRWIDRYKRG